MQHYSVYVYLKVMRMNILFSVKCTKSLNDRFKVGKVYDLFLKDGTITWGNGNAIIPVSITDGCTIREAFIKWYQLCNWMDYDFELVENKYVVTLL